MEDILKRLEALRMEIRDNAVDNIDTNIGDFVCYESSRDVHRGILLIQTLNGIIRDIKEEIK